MRPSEGVAELEEPAIALRVAVLDAVGRVGGPGTRGVDEAGAEVADDFIDRLEAKLDNIKKNPELYRVVTKDLRSAELDRFPYSIVYRIISRSLIRVTTIRHHKQHPDFGLRR